MVSAQSICRTELKLGFGNFEFRRNRVKFDLWFEASTETDHPWVLVVWL